MTTSKQAPKKPTARQKLTPSSLHPTQLELMGDDVDLTKLYVALGAKDFNIVDAVTDITVARTIEGASTVTVDVADNDRKLLRSGVLSHRLTTEIDGLFFTLASVDKNNADLTLTFEDREVYTLRTYNKPIKQSAQTSRATVTRAEFVLRMLREVQEFPIRFVIPELTKVQPIGKSANLPSATQRAQDKTFGIPKVNDLTVKGSRMTEEQRVNANTVLDTGVSFLIPLNESVVRKCLVMSMMAVIQESTMYNLLGGDRDSVGLFQQRRSQGWPATRDIPVDATEFFKRLRAYVTQHPDAAYYAAIQAVQISGFPTAYAQWRTEAERIVTSYGMTSGTAASNNLSLDAIPAVNGDYEFYRGIPPTSAVQKKKGRGGWGKESSWDAIQRMAEEVNWRAFFVSGTFYYISDEDLFKSQPIATLSEDSPGVVSINGNYDEGKKSATVTLQIEMGRWPAPPGSVISLKDMGPWDGRWLVNDVTRSLFSRLGTITLKKPLPILPEPTGSNLSQTASSTTWTGKITPAAPSGGTAQPGANPRTGDSASLAGDLLLLSGRSFFDDRGSAIGQLQKIKAGQQLRNQCGNYVSEDPRVLGVLLWLIDQGYQIGIFALTEDHHCETGGHSAGLAVDISSINGQAINKHTDVVRQLVIEVDQLLRKAGSLRPRQLISGGYGYVRDFEISALSLPAADQYYGASTMQEHTNHIHVGY